MKHDQTTACLINNSRDLFCSSALALLLVSSAPFAKAQTDGLPQSDDETARLATVTVTGTKREQTLQETPVAISVVGAEEIERAEILDFQDLQTLVPSLTIRQQQSSASTSFFIRGFGNGANAIGLEPSVGIFVDGVYRSRAAAYIPDLPNLERVEVLRGPQSTLFGKNASAGVVSVVTRGPQFEPSGNIEASVGNFNALRLKGGVTGPITETLAFGLSGSVNQRDGYAEDLGNGEKYNERDRWGIRGELRFVPNENLDVRFIADYDQIDEQCCLLTNIVEVEPTIAEPITPSNVVRSLGGQVVSEDPFSYDVFYDLIPINEIENYGFSLHSEYDFGFATLTNILANRTSNSLADFDSDATNINIFGSNVSDTEIETFTQEIRLTSNPSESRLDWMIGAYFLDETIDIESSLAYGDEYRAFLSGLVGNPALFPALEVGLNVPVGTFAAAGQGVSESISQDNEAWSIFGTVDYRLTDRLTGTIGLNYTEDEKQVRMDVQSTDALAAVNLDQLGYTAALQGLLAQQGVNLQNPASVGPFVQANPMLYAQLQQQALAVAQSENNPFDILRPLQVFPQFLSFPNAVENGQTSDSDTSYLLRLNYEINDNINVYGSYSTGFKASSWNLQRQSAPFASDFTPGNPIVDPVTSQLVFQTPSSTVTDAGLFSTNLSSGSRFAGPEEAEVFELGLKAQFDEFAVSVAVFDQSIEGFQTSIFNPDEGFVLQNADKQSTTGIEFDATWSPTRPLTLTFAGTFLDAEYDEFPGGAVDEDGNPIDLSGQTPQGVADTQFTLGGNFNFRIADMGGYVRADWQFVGDSNFFDNPIDQLAVDQAGYTREQNLVNASVGIMTKNEILVSVWARNLFENEFLVGASPAPIQEGNYNGIPNQPRTFGITVKKKF